MKKAKKQEKAASKKQPRNKKVAVLAIALLATLAGLGMKLKQDMVPKYAAGTCWASSKAPEAYVIESNKDGRYKGIHVILMFGLELNVPVAQLNAAENLVPIDCKTGEKM